MTTPSPTIAFFLNERFGLGDELKFNSAQGGATLAEIANSHATATIALQGAHLTGWAPRGETAVIWMSPAARFAQGKPIRGGIPICWPWFGAHASAAEFPSHGFARISPWEITETRRLANGATRLVFRLVQNDFTASQWPHPTPVELQIDVGLELELELRTFNLAPAPVTIAAALHTYFEVSDIREVSVQGLDGCPYLDKLDEGRRKRQSGPVVVSAEMDRIYLDSTADCLIDDPGLRRRIRITKHGSRSTVVWNPWSEKAAAMEDLGPDTYLHMLCVESANVAEDAVTIPPGCEHRLGVRYGLEPWD